MIKKLFKKLFKKKKRNTIDMIKSVEIWKCHGDSEELILRTDND